MRTEENALSSDLDSILEHSGDSWSDLKGARIFVTGGTGFIGTWLLESLVWANARLGLGAKAVVLTRDRSAFERKAPHLALSPAVSLIEGDVRSFEFPDGQFSHVIHAATAASAKLNLEEPFEMISTIVDGSRRLFDFVGACRASKVLQTSSGGIYGRQPVSMPLLTEEFLGAPDPMDPYAAYSEAKRLAEMIGRIASEKFGFEHKVARITALVGPHLPLDAHYAMGNFIRDALAGGPIRIRGNGRPERSYLYIADLVAWLWVILVRGKSNRPYNAGSDRPLALRDAAEVVRRVHGIGAAVVVENQAVQDGRPDRYVPSVERARNELGLRQWVDLDTAVRKTLAWHANLVRSPQS
jgi:dTDP-glucose 4,6-dehydratase